MGGQGRHRCSPRTPAADGGGGADLVGRGPPPRVDGVPSQRWRLPLLLSVRAYGLFCTTQTLLRQRPRGSVPSKLMVDEEGGIHVAQANLEPLVRAMRTLIDDHERREAVGCPAARERAHIIAPESVLPRFGEFYRDILALERLDPDVAL